MIEFTQEDLYKATTRYMESREELVSQAEACVVDWKNATAEMSGMFPLFDAVGFRGHEWWTPADRKWLQEGGSVKWYSHGFDAGGNIRIIKAFNKSITLFVFGGEIIDEVRYGAAVPLTRSILRDGRVVAAYDYVLHPHQYRLEQFEYAGDRCVRSVSRSWYVSDGKWVAATWATTCEFEYDERGLHRAYRDMGEGLGGRTLVYVRPTSAPEPTLRRPLVAHRIGIFDDDPPWQSVYSHAYGLEMTIDSDWPIDTVLLAPPELVGSITQDTDVTSMGTVYGGASFMPEDRDPSQIVADGARWLLLEGTTSPPDDVRAALLAGLNVILAVAAPHQIEQALGAAGRVAPERIAIAVSAPSKYSPEWAHEIAGTVRKALRSRGLGESRILIAANLTKDNLMDYLCLADVDGVLLSDGDASLTLEVLKQLALNIQGGNWKRQ